MDRNCLKGLEKMFTLLGRHGVATVLQKRNSRCRRCVFEPLEPRALLSAGGAGALTVHPLFKWLATSSTPVGYMPAQIRHAYGFDSVAFGASKGDGTGQTIAMVDAYDDPKIVSSYAKGYAASDLARFNQAAGLPDFGPGGPTFTKVNEKGGAKYPKANSGWAMEIALDVEWAHAMAPGANLLLVEAASNAYSDLLTAVDYARNYPGVSVVSISWGAPEIPADIPWDYHFTTPSGHAGVSFVAASGDSGPPAVWPAVAPTVVGVGGTTLSLDSGNNWSAESGWGTAPWAASGSGPSWFQPQPAYQASIALPDVPSGRRMSPDVAYDSDPNTGLAVYDTVPYQGRAGWSEMGGTSAGVPQWAALIAIANQGRARPLEDMPADLYAIYQDPSRYARDFHDIQTGNNGIYTAGPGYDLVTGLGSPVADALTADLAASADYPPPVLKISAADAVYHGSPSPATVTVAGTDGIAASSLEGVTPSLLYYDLGRSTVSTTAPGTGGFYEAVAAFPGSAHYAPTVSKPVAFFIFQASTTTSLGASVNPSRRGQPVTFTATVSPMVPGIGTPTGMVTFKEGKRVLGKCPLINGAASLTVRTLSVSRRPHKITAIYGGDADFASSSANLAQRIRGKAARRVAASAFAWSRPGARRSDDRARDAALMAVMDEWSPLQRRMRF